MMMDESPPYTIAEINDLDGWDHRIVEFDGWRLRIRTACTSYPETWSGEIEFEGVSYVECPVEFSHPTYRRPSSDEQRVVAARTIVEEDDRIIAIDAETMASMGSQTFFIVCRQVSRLQRNDGRDDESE